MRFVCACARTHHTTLGPRQTNAFINHRKLVLSTTRRFIISAKTTPLLPLGEVGPTLPTLEQEIVPNRAIGFQWQMITARVLV